MKRRVYAGEVSKEYLERLGIEYVSPDGKTVVKNGKIANINVNKKAKKPYGMVVLYDPELRQTFPIEERNSSSGNMTMGIHVINYVWNTGETKPAGMVVHHRDNNPLNNDISNLELITQRENVLKERPLSTREIKCKMNKPRSFYEDKLLGYEMEYERARFDGDQELCHKLRTNMAQSRARLRYWDNHKEEYENFVDNKGSVETMKKEKTQDQKNLDIVLYWKKVFKDAGNKAMWRQCCTVEKKWKNGELTEELKEHIINVLCGLR